MEFDTRHRDLVHLIWYRLHSVAGAMFYSTFLVPQTGSSQANQKVIYCTVVVTLNLIKMKHNKFVCYLLQNWDN